MRRRKWIFLVLAPFAFAAFIFIGGELVMHLWNWLAPALFGWRQIGFWQALGLLLLCRILFGGFGMHGSGRSNMRHRMQERWERRFAERWEEMTPEERERFRQRFRDRCGPFDPPASNPNPAQG